jgi:hypothetical protein
MVRRKKKELEVFKKEISFGIVFGLIVFAITLMDKLLYTMPQIVGVFLDLYGKCGYDRTYIGSVLGLAYGFITGYVLAVVYNWFYRRI